MTANGLWEALHAHASALLGGWLRTARQWGWHHLEERDGLVQWPEEVQALFERVNNVDEFGASDAPPSSLCRQKLEVDLELALSAGDAMAERWWNLRSTHGLSGIEVQALALCVVMGADHMWARAFRYGWADFGRWDLPWGFLVRLLAHGEERELRVLQEVSEALDPVRSRLFGAGWLELVDERGGGLLSNRSVHVSDELVAWLSGRPWTAVEHVECEALPELPGALKASMREFVQRMFRQRAEVGEVVLRGPAEGQELALARELVRAIAAGGAWVLDLGLEVELERGVEALERARRCSAMVGAVVVVVGLDALHAHGVDRRRRWIAEARRLFANSGVTLVWVSTTRCDALAEVPAEHCFDFGYPDRGERRRVWEVLLGSGWSDEVLDQLSGRFLLTEGQIGQVVEETALGDGHRAETLFERARERAAIGLGRLASAEAGRVDLSQLVVAEDTRTLLEEIAAYARGRHRLATEWGFARQMPYGLGLTALFSGPSGTGKTMAAMALATRLSLELYRVDLSQLVSKYIGETEKHLAMVFDAADSGGVMLLFDEADSLFGKRTEVKTAVDRYANLEVNYLLQRIERFGGIVVLTTNFETGIDDAFSRRIRFRVHFDVPDAEARRGLWRALIPTDVPLEQGIDLTKLAATWELSGGHIKEVVLRAASLAMEAGTEVTEALLARSAEAEYRKLGRLTPGSGRAMKPGQGPAGTTRG